MKTQKVSVVIPCHNGWPYTKLCLSSVLKSDYPNFHIIVVDDGSTDSTSEYIAKEFQNVEVLKGDGNLWWSGSMNLGIREAIKKQTEYVLVLNNDVVIAPDALSALMNCAKENPHAVIGSMVYELNHSNLIWSAGGTMKWPWPGEIQLGIGEIDNGQYNEIRNVKWAPGMGTLIHREILLQLNLYDDLNMPQYIADVDFCLRSEQASYPVLITPKSKIFNNSDNTGGIKKEKRKIKWIEFKEIFTSLRSPDYLRARLIFMFRHCPWYLLIPALLIRYTRLIIFTMRRL